MDERASHMGRGLPGGAALICRPQITLRRGGGGHRGETAVAPQEWNPIRVAELVPNDHDWLIAPVLRTVSPDRRSALTVPRYEAQRLSRSSDHQRKACRALIWAAPCRLCAGRLLRLRLSDHRGGSCG